MSSRQRTAPKTSAEDVRLMEQVRFLTEENKRLQDLLASHNQSPNNKFAVNANNVADPSRLISSTQIMAATTSTPTTHKNNGKGCSCRGNCGTRVCGCVKRQSACREACRCSNALCQNQDPNKENKEENQAQLTREDEENIEKFSRLNLKDKKQSKREKKPMGQKQSKQEEQRTPGLSNKRLEKVNKPSSIFSPDIEDNVFDFQDTEMENFSLRFGDDVAQTETAMNNDESHETREEGAKRKKRPLRNTVKNREGEKSRPEGLQVPTVSRKVRSMSNEESISGKSVEAKKPTKKRSISTDGEVGVPKNLGALLRGLRPMRKQGVNSRRARVNNDESEHETNIDDKKTNKRNAKTKGMIKNKEKENDAADSQSDEDSNLNDKKGKKNKKKQPKKGKNNDPTEKQDTEDPIESDGQSNIPEKKLRTKTKKKTLNKGKNNVPTEMEDHTDDPIDSQQATSSNHPKSKSKTNIKKKSTQKSKKNISIEKENSTEDPIESDDESENDNSENNLTTKTKEMPVKEGKNNNSVEKENTEDEMKLAEELSNSNDRSDAENQISSQDISIKEENNIDLLDEQNNVENPTESGSSDQSDHETWVKSENEEGMMSKEEIIHEQSEYSETSPLNISIQSDPSRQQNTFSPKANEDFNPMIPRRQLSRSPAQLSVTTPQLLQSPTQLSRSPAPRSPINQTLNTTSRRMHDPSERPLPIPLQEEPEFEPPPPEELSRDIVDWEEHKQRLVHCRKCNRTFHPHRINKHEKFCKRV